MRRVAIGRFIALLLALGLSLASRAAQACAGCSNPNLPTARAANVALPRGQISLALSLTATTMRVVHPEACPDIGPICRRRAEPPQQHDQRFYVAELRQIVALGLTDVLGAEFHLPFRVVNTTIRFRRLDGTVFEPDYENIHHRNETLYGLADPWLLGRATGTIGPVRITSRAGAALPVGSIQEDPFARGRAGLPHQHIQFGTGTISPVFAVDAGLTLGHARLSAYGQGLVFVYANTYGYQPGNRYSGGMTGDYALSDRLRVGIGADVINEQPERWGGLVQQDGNVGRTDVLAGGAISYAFGSVVASLTARTPVYQHFIESSHDHGGDPGQLTYPVIATFAIQTLLGAATPK